MSGAAKVVVWLAAIVAGWAVVGLIVWMVVLALAVTS